MFIILRVAKSYAIMVFSAYKHNEMGRAGLDHKPGGIRKKSGRIRRKKKDRTAVVSFVNKSVKLRKTFKRKAKKMPPDVRPSISPTIMINGQ